MPAVGSPEPGGPGIDELAALLAPLVDHPKALGMAITLYDPSLDPDRSCAERLVALLDSVLGRRSDAGQPVDRCVASTSSARRAAPGRTRRVRNEPPRLSALRACWRPAQAGHRRQRPGRCAGFSLAGRPSEPTRHECRCRSQAWPGRSPIASRRVSRRALRSSCWVATARSSSARSPGPPSTTTMSGSSTSISTPT